MSEGRYCVGVGPLLGCLAKPAHGLGLFLHHSLPLVHMGVSHSPASQCPEVELSVGHAARYDSERCFGGI